MVKYNEETVANDTHFLEMKMTNNSGDESGSQDTAVILRSQDTQ